MEGFFLLIAVAFIIYVIFQLNSLKGRVEELEQKGSTSHKVATSVNLPSSPSSSSSSMTSEFSTPSSSHLPSFIQWLKTDWLMKLGALFVLLAIVWFVRHAFMEGWIGEMGRIALGLIVSTLILAGGFSQLKKRPVPGQVLMTLGTTGIMATVFAARSFYDIFTPLSAMGIMVFLVLMIAVVSIANNSLALGVISFLGGIIAPILTVSHDQNYLFLNAYLLALNCGIFAMVAMKGWRILLPLALISTGFYSFGTFESGNLTQTGTQIFMALYYALFFIGISSAIVYTKKVTIGDAITMALTVILGVYWVGEHVPPEWQSSALSVAVVFAAITLALAVKIGAPQKIVYLNLAAAVGLLGAATAFELEGATLVIVLALETVGIITFIRYVLDDLKATIISSLLLSAPILLSLESFAWGHKDTLLNQDFFVLFIVGAVIGLVSLLIHGLQEHKEFNENQGMITSFFIATIVAATIFLGGLIWNSAEVLIEANDSAHGVALVIYTIIALGMFFMGIVNQDKKIKAGGIIILVGVISRLVLVEIWNMSLTQRTITFIVIGILLITTAFFQKKQHLINK